MASCHPVVWCLGSGSSMYHFRVICMSSYVSVRTSDVMDLDGLVRHEMFHVVI